MDLYDNILKRIDENSSPSNIEGMGNVSNADISGDGKSNLGSSDYNYGSGDSYGKSQLISLSDYNVSFDDDDEEEDFDFDFF